MKRSISSLLAYIHAIDTHPGGQQELVLVNPCIPKSFMQANYTSWGQQELVSLNPCRSKSAARVHQLKMTGG